MNKKFIRTTGLILLLSISFIVCFTVLKNGEGKTENIRETESDALEKVYTNLNEKLSISMVEGHLLHTENIRFVNGEYKKNKKITMIGDRNKAGGYEYYICYEKSEDEKIQSETKGEGNASHVQVEYQGKLKKVEDTSGMDNITEKDNVYLIENPVYITYNKININKEYVENFYDNSDVKYVDGVLKKIADSDAYIIEAEMGECKYNIVISNTKEMKIEYENDKLKNNEKIGSYVRFEYVSQMEPGSPYMNKNYYIDNPDKLIYKDGKIYEHLNENKVSVIESTFGLDLPEKGIIHTYEVSGNAMVEIELNQEDYEKIKEELDDSSYEKTDNDILDGVMHNYKTKESIKYAYCATEKVKNDTNYLEGYEPNSTAICKIGLTECKNGTFMIILDCGQYGFVIG